MRIESIGQFLQVRRTGVREPTPLIESYTWSLKRKSRWKYIGDSFVIKFLNAEARGDGNPLLHYFLAVTACEGLSMAYELGRAIDYDS